MRIGLVGKPNVGKSTTFSAMTQTPVDIANYPFTTIEPNVGVAWLPLPSSCACYELRERREAAGRLEPSTEDDPRRGSICTPNSGSCTNHRRLVPVTLVDVAGLVPGAHEGKGRGNQFLSDLARCDALIQVVDVSGSTDIDGNPVGSGGSDPIEEHRFLVNELEEWIAGILSTGWKRGARKAQAEGDRALLDYAVEQLTGIGATEHHVVAGFNAVRSGHPDADVPWEWGESEMKSMSAAIRNVLFPISVAANKADLAMSGSWTPLAEMIGSAGGVLVATSAEAELALSRASQAGLIERSPGESEFEITQEGEERLSQTQRKALAAISESLVWDGGGLVGLLSEVVFGTLSRRVAYPVQDETHWVDGDGNTLPDALLVEQGTTAKGLAYAVHSDLGDGFIRAVDARSSRVIGAEHEVQDGDVISIYAKT
ncbi:MAG: YchF-related putative GTPase [Candidatus Thermoplasmatota archaeon]|nr:YchF-related putative GTPase [Candidatus Thermoplasmatota archaeon]